jgi:hypothetical protein
MGKFDSYEKVVVRRWETVFPRLVGMTVTLFALGLTSWQTIPDTRMDFVHSRVRYHCVETKNPTDACKQAVEGLPENLRLRLVRPSSTKNLQTPLSYRILSVISGFVTLIVSLRIK